MEKTEIGIELIKDSMEALTSYNTVFTPRPLRSFGLPEAFRGSGIGSVAANSKLP